MHGTGTPVGDPLEVEAVSRVFAELKTPEDPLLIGSVSRMQFSGSLVSLGKRRWEAGTRTSVADESGDMRLTPLPPDGKNADAVADASAPPPAIAQRIERNTSMKVNSLWSNTSASPSPSTVKRNIELPRTHSGPPQRSNSKLFRRLSRSTSPITAAKHRRTFPGPITSSQNCAKERPASVDPVVVAVYDYLSSPRLSQKVIDPQTGRVNILFINFVNIIRKISKSLR